MPTDKSVNLPEVPVWLAVGRPIITSENIDSVNVLGDFIRTRVRTSN